MRILIPNTDPDSGQPNLLRIHTDPDPHTASMHKNFSPVRRSVLPIPGEQVQEKSGSTFSIEHREK
jgi:hypothetical protein